MGRGEPIGRRQNVPCHGVEYAWILFKNSNIKHFLRVIEPQMSELGIEPSILRSKVRDAKRSRYSGASEDNDVFRLFN